MHCSSNAAAAESSLAQGETAEELSRQGESGGGTDDGRSDRRDRLEFPPSSSKLPTAFGVHGRRRRFGERVEDGG